MEFLYAFLQRVLSGLQSYAGYSRNVTVLVLMTGIMIFFPLVNYQSHWLFYTFLFINLLVAYGKMVSFEIGWMIKIKYRFKDIHMWESLLTGGYFIYLTLAGYNIILLCCSVYPALLLHKGLINLGSGLHFFAEATDDPSGKTYGIPTLGIKINRSSTKFRIIVAGLSLVILGLVWIWGFNVSLPTL